MRLRSWVANLVSLVVGCCLVAGCAPQPRPTSTRPSPRRIVPPPKTQVPAPPIRTTEKIVGRCLSGAEIRKLRAARPRPLRDQKMPATAAERVAKTAAQLGLYEAKGRWADQVEKALAECEGK